MFHTGSLGDVIILLVMLVLVPLVPAVFYLATLHGALAACAPANRKLAPGLVWLQLTPLLKGLGLATGLGLGLATGLARLGWIPVIVGVLWQFVVVVAVSGSIGAELRARGIPEDPQPRLKLGLWMAAFAALTSVTPPPTIMLFSIPCFILWITYWIRIAGLRRLLNSAPHVSVVPASH